MTAPQYVPLAAVEAALRKLVPASEALMEKIMTELARSGLTQPALACEVFNPPGGCAQSCAPVEDWCAPCIRAHQPTPPDDGDEDPKCTCGRYDRTDWHEWSPGCDDWPSDLDDEPLTARAHQPTPPAQAEAAATYKPDHCPTCRCEPVGPLPAGVAVDPYCPEHGSLPTAYSDCSCLRAAQAEEGSL